MMKRTNIYCFLLLLILTFANSSSIFAKDDILLDNPRNAVFNHINNLQKDNFKPDIALRSFNINKLSKRDAKELPIKLLRIYNGLGLHINFKHISEDINFIDSNSGKHKYIIFKQLPDIYLEKYGNNWQYSTESVAQIENIYNSTFKFDSLGFVQSLPEYWRDSYLGLQVWQMLGLLLLFVINCIMYIILWFISKFIIVKVSKSINNKGNHLKYAKSLAKSISLLLVTFAFTELLILLELPGKLNAFIWFLIRALQPILLTFIAYRIIDYAIDIYLTTSIKVKNSIGEHIVPIIHKVAHAFIIVVGLLYLLNNLGIDITPLVAGFSVVGLAIALAAQDTVRHFIGSLTIFADQPFLVGDLILYEGIEGFVERIGIRSTRIRSLDNSLITVPNGKITDNKVDNLGKRDARRLKTELSIAHNTSSEKIQLFIDGIKDAIRTHELIRQNDFYVSLYDVSDSSIIIFIQLHFVVLDIENELKARHKLFTDIINLADRLDIKFAFQRNSIYFENFPQEKRIN